MKTVVASFWTGSPLSFFEQVCLKSFADLGHRTILYSYDSDLAVPEGVELMDAGTIMPQTRLTQHGIGFAPFADMFRVNMIHQTGAIWIDCDVAAVRPMPDAPYVFAPSQRWIGNAVMRLPKDSAALGLLVDLLNAEELAFPPDWPWRHLLPEAVRQRTPEGEPFRLRDDERPLLPYMSLGPVALTYALRKTGELKFAMPGEAFYPFHPINLRRNYYRPRLARLDLPKAAVAVHHIGGKPFRVGFADKGGYQPPHERSFIAKLCRRHGIDPAAAPPRIAARPAAAPAEPEGTAADTAA